MSGSNLTHYIYWKLFSSPIEGKNNYVSYSGQPSIEGNFYKLGIQEGNDPDSRYNLNKSREGELSWYNLFESHTNIHLMGPYTYEDALFLEEAITELIKVDLGWKGKYLKNFGAEKMFNGLTEFVLPKESTHNLIERIFSLDPNVFLNESRKTLSRVDFRGV